MAHADSLRQLDTGPSVFPSKTGQPPFSHIANSSRAARVAKIPAQWKIEPDVGRMADGIPHRVDRLRGLGNAVVPQVAEVIGHLVMAHAGM